MALYLEACENEMPQKATLKASCGDGVRLGLGSLHARRGGGWFSSGFHEANEPVIGWGCYSTIYQMVILELSRPCSNGCRSVMSRSWHPILYTRVCVCLAYLWSKFPAMAVSLEGW